MSLTLANIEDKMKKFLIAVLFVIAVGGGILMFLFKSISFDWPHHFSFENGLGIDIDSLEIEVGNVKTMIRAGSDNSKFLHGNINVPEHGYPHLVTINIFSNQEILTMKANSFNCYNCDGTHQYSLKDSIAEYKFFN